jgi:RNA polymerase sigma factor (sigma-70 family)
LDHIAPADETLFARWQNERDEKAFSDIEHRYRNQLLGYAIHRLKRMGVPDQEGRAGERVQETFLKLALRTEPLPCIRTWLYRVLGNRLIDEGRTAGRRRGVFSASHSPRLEHEWSETADADLDPIDEVINGEEVTADVERFRRALEDLTDEDFRLLVLHHIEERSYEEISRRTGLTHGQITSRLHRARQRWRAGYTRSQVEARTKHP